MKQSYYRYLVSFTLLLISFHSFAVCLSGTVTVGTGGNYLTFNGANGLFNAINTNGITSDLIVHVISDITETSTTPLTPVNYCAAGPYTITVLAFNGNRTVSCSMTTALISLSGGKRVTFGGGADTLSFMN